MALNVGTQLGPHEITALLGKGGMGEVYRARDTKLKRDVAIKVLPEEFVRDADRLSRFQREAEVLASLNHPNIAQVYGLEDSTSQTCIVMELVEGETLQDRLQRGPISLDESLLIAKQIAEALQAAHEGGVVHRDLKPGNIKRTPNGKAKLLDFGLAKSVQGSTTLSKSPTLMSGSVGGAILGTVAYMSPEQAKGREADRTSDIWAFGCVLYEMLTARAVFEGETIGEVLASVFRDEPDWTRLPATTPESIRRLLRRCLKKDQARRLHDMSDALLEIDDAQNEPAAPIIGVPAKSKSGEWIVWISGMVLLLAVTTWALLAVRKPPAPQRMLLDIAASTDIYQISPDGRNLVYSAADGDHQKLWMRALDSGSTRPLAGTEDGRFIWWSPDSRTLGFSGNDRLKRIDIETGAITVLGETPVFRGATSNKDGVVLIGTNTTGPILRFSGSGDSTPVTPVLAQQTHYAPHFLPDGQHFLYHAVIVGSRQPAGLYLAQLGSTETRHLLDTALAVYAAGRLFYLQQGKLLAQEFDVSKGTLKGNPSIVAQPENGPVSSFSVSQTGTIVYRTASLTKPAQFIWVDRSGNQMGQPVAEIESSNGASLSPDGQRLAQPRSDGDLWIRSLSTGASNRYTFDPASDTFPLWSPQGDRIVFSSNRKGTYDLYVKLADAGTAEEPLTVSDQSKVATDWSADGRFLLYRTIDPKTSYDIWALPFDGDKKPFPLVQTTSDDRDAQFSPDGKFIAYQSNRSGRYEIYVERFQASGIWQISTEGGVQVRWRQDGKELFYLTLDGRLVSLPVHSTGETFSAGAQVSLFKTRLPAGLIQSTNRHSYMVSADGMRFLSFTPNTEPAGPPIPITILLNWNPDQGK